MGRPSRISPAENDALIVPLSDEEIWDVIKSANSNAASGRHGFSIPFFKRFWPQLKALVYKIIQGFCLVTVDISCLNYAVISLIPKVKGAELISQFSPTPLINNMAKFPAKGFSTRLSPVASHA
ncbi:Peroxidase [Hordeum vulgare]|nr:Peroxidase [Hordeum vulgare]